MQINVQQAATQTSVIQAEHLVNNEAIQMLGKKRRGKKHNPSRHTLLPRLAQFKCNQGQYRKLHKQFLEVFGSLCGRAVAILISVAPHRCLKSTYASDVKPISMQAITERTLPLSWTMADSSRVFSNRPVC